MSTDFRTLSEETYNELLKQLHELTRRSRKLNARSMWQQNRLYINLYSFERKKRELYSINTDDVCLRVTSNTVIYFAEICFVYLQWL